MKEKLSSNKDLPELLEKLNTDGRYDKIIVDARAFHFHDYKSPLDVSCPKVHLVAVVSEFPELSALRTRIINGDFDDEADEADKEEMRKSLPESMWSILGL